ncbi:MAG TPA: D-glycero-beta-D-manno-heptose 1-phosphate adenylyltransferase [Steroidobacteraceae bacterium]|jgi:D-beta-D-heptose 7-phosphate kinase/D-beta-D-heptose 1-phosphate adenosyltransferase|nr:D-glycero-beta-D-manno-heptose 1-phosphate adenylyltransferase [Steroidobacteraceae bacterium]
MSEPAHAASSAALLAILERCRGLHLWVVGDLMLDEYCTGDVERISPEAPVPIVRVRDSEHRLGGAANVARQAAALGARVSLGGIAGDDAEGAELLRLCGAADIDSRAVLKLPERRTTRKLRVLGRSQQLLRLDWEDALPCPHEASARLLARLAEGAPPAAIILSDYAKGALTPQAISAVLGARASAPVVVDPKHQDFARYRGATTVTPNLRELEAAAGQVLDADDTAAIAAAARPLIAAAGLQSMVVTLGSRGMLVVPGGQAEIAVPGIRREVYDVTGAGDTAVAVLALALGAQATLLEAAQLANAAAGVAVGQIGAVAVDAASIRDALVARPDSKILSREDLAARAASWRMAGKQIVFTNGCFDLLHAGHLSLLGHAARLGDVLVLAINSDASVRRLKGADRPLVPQAERAALLAALSFVDAVTIFDDDTPLEILRAVRPQVLVKGGDYQPAQVVGREFVESGGGRVEIVPLVPEKSTASLVERIRRLDKAR